MEREKFRDQNFKPHSCFATDDYKRKHTVPSSAFLHSYNYNYDGKYCNQTVENVFRMPNNFDNNFQIQSNEDSKINKQYSNEYLSRNMGEHALFKNDSEYTPSIQYLPSNNAGSRFLINPNSCTCKINDETMKLKHLCEENKPPSVKFREKNDLIPEHKNLTSNEKFLADKTTYCRPVLNLYNQEFLFKTMERNARLKRVVRKLAIARQREREDVSWNNFINELRNRHDLSCEDLHPTTPTSREPEQYITPDVIDDVYRTRFSKQQSRLCRNLLQDFYGTYNTTQTSNSNRRPCNRDHSMPYDTDPYCYPTSSQGRLILLEREKRKNQFVDPYYKLSNKSNICYDNPTAKKYDQRTFASTRSYNKVLTSDFYNCAYIDQKENKSCTNHTDSIMQTCRKEIMDDNIIRDKIVQVLKNNKLIQVVESAEKITDTNQYFEIPDYLKQTRICNIEKKLETLIDSINIFINEIRSSKRSKRKVRSVSVTCETNNDIYKRLNMTRSDTVGMMTTEHLFCDVVNDSSGSTLTISKLCPNKLRTETKIDNIVKGNETLISKDLLKDQPCSVEITFEVPTKDCSTEVTKSLSKQNFANKNESIEEISTPYPAPTQRMTIAVNTDPLSFLSLLRISTETLKGVLSYMPNIAFYSYLSLLQFPHSRRNMESQYMCNICGAAFNASSKLSDHIQEHNLGKTRDCCVCRHVLNINRKHPRLYSCQFCGQRFTRAYCCELHQKSCARHLGRSYDVASSLMLLR